ncbi:MAG TPA: hypothetical protein VI306_15300 [Pyrinomonadaceae bacterium]
MAIIQVNANDDLQDAIDNAEPGDVIEVEAGADFDGTFVLPEHSILGVGDGDYITIRSANHLSLPAGRVSASDAVNMPRIRTVSSIGEPAFLGATNANYWKLDGLEITDDAGSNTVNALMSFGSDVSGINHFIVTRCYIHQKETGTTYTRSAVRAMIFNGDYLSYTRCCIEIIGYPYGGSTEPHNSEALLVGSGSNIVFEENDSTVWYNHIFLGGGDTPPTHTATLSSASTTSATFSNVTGLEVGAFVRFSVIGTATLSNAGGTPTLTRLTGAPWVAADGNQNGNWGDSCLITSQADPSKTGITRLMSLTGDDVFTTAAAISSVAAIPNGTVDFTIYQTAKVTAIAGNVVTYDPDGTTAGIDYNTNALNKVPASAAWCSGDEGTITDVSIKRNTLHNDPVFADYLHGIGRGCPKGVIEVKNCNRLVFEGNQITGYPAVLAFTAANQYGSAPWIRVDQVEIRSNWFRPDEGFDHCARAVIAVTDDAYLNTITPTALVTIENNLATSGVRSFLDVKNGGVWNVRHNTTINDQSSDIGSNALVNGTEGVAEFNFHDNIGGVVCYGFIGYPSSFPVRSILNNVLVDADVGCSGGIDENTYGTGSALTPIPTAFDLFTDSENGIYSLADESPYKGQGTDSKDPGVDWLELLAALNPEDGIGLSNKIIGSVILQGNISIL